MELKPCPFVQELMKRESFKMSEFEEHIRHCPQCQAILRGIKADLQEAIEMLLEEGRPRQGEDHESV